MVFQFIDSESGSSKLFSISSALSSSLKDYLRTLIEGASGLVVEDSSDPSVISLVDPRAAVDDTEEEASDLCYTYVRTCIEGARRDLEPHEIDELWPILVKPDGMPLEVFFHGTIKDKRRLRLKVTQCGGIRVGSMDACDIILVERSYDLEHDDYADLKLELAYDPSVRVELPEWVDDCMRARHLLQSRDFVREQPNKTATARGVPFTHNEIVHLVEYLAEKIPFKETRGRAGHRVYQELCEDEEGYPWATRHPWQAWNNKYKKNQDMFDEMISEHLDEHPELQTRRQENETLTSVFRRARARAKGRAKQPRDEEMEYFDITADVADERPSIPRSSPSASSPRSSNARNAAPAQPEQEDDDIDDKPQPGPSTPLPHPDVPAPPSKTPVLPSDRNSPTTPPTPPRSMDSEDEVLAALTPKAVRTSKAKAKSPSPPSPSPTPSPNPKPKQGPTRKATYARRKGKKGTKRTGAVKDRDANEFPEVREGDDAAPPDWAKRRQDAKGKGKATANESAPAPNARGDGDEDQVESESDDGSKVEDAILSPAQLVAQARRLRSKPSPEVVITSPPKRRKR